MKSLMIRNLHQILFGLSYRGDGWDKYWVENRCIQVWWGNFRERLYLEYAGIEGRIILNCLFRMWDGGMDWIDLTDDRNGW
jgi:hypothetical protein